MDILNWTEFKRKVSDRFVYVCHKFKHTILVSFIYLIDQLKAESMKFRFKRSI